MLKKCRRCWSASILDWQSYCEACRVAMLVENQAKELLVGAIPQFEGVEAVESKRGVYGIVSIREFPLKIELIPKTLWYKSLRSVVNDFVWRKLRSEVILKAGSKCDVCGYHWGLTKLYCHEVWEYNDVEYIQKLNGLECTCEWCHRIHHLGLAEVQLRKVEINKMIWHYRQVNGCTFHEFKVERDKAFALWERRSKVEWVQDFGEYKGLLKVENVIDVHRTKVI